MTMPEPGGASAELLKLLRCPISGSAFRWLSSSVLISAIGDHAYKCEEGIFHLLTPLSSEAVSQRLREEKARTQAHYEEMGWQLQAGTYGEVASFTDERSAPWSYTSRCINRVQKQLQGCSGGFLLDVASGPIPYAEYLGFDANFGRRVCVDLSLAALREAQRKLGDRGIYILGDLTRLPIADNQIDAAVSLHTIYHIPADEQEDAFLELHRVLKPGGRAVVVYSWGYSPLNSRLLRALHKLGRPAAPAVDADRLYYSPQEKEWFFGKAWPFEYTVSTWRSIGSSALQMLGSGTIFKLLYRCVFAVESLFPKFFGRHGQYPLIVLTKELR